LSGDQVAAYQYDGFQHRIVTTVGNGPAAIARDLFYSAGWQVLEQRIRAGGSLGSEAEEQYVWSVAYIDGLILRDRNADLNAATGAGGLEQRVYALQDALWNTTGLVDVNGNVLNRFAYTPYGVVETLNANWTPTGSPSIPWAVLFRGYFADEGTGLLYARARMYSPGPGRFIGRDPAGYVDGLGLYMAYFVPNGADPYGLITIKEVEELFQKEMEEALKRQRERKREQGGYIVKDKTGKYFWIVGDDKNNTETSAELPPYYPDPNDPSKRSSDQDGKLEIVADWHTHPPVEGGCSREDKKGKDDERKGGGNVPLIIVYPLPKGFGVDSY